jgi:hypothetical protein
MNNVTFNRVNAKVKNDTIIISKQTVDNKTIEGIGFLQNDTYYGLHGAITLKYKITYNETGDVNDFGFVIGQPAKLHK